MGASEAVDLALRATCDPGDEVILHEPSYVAYVPAIVFAGGTPVHVATRFEDDFALDPAAVEAAITPRTKALFLGYPCNPTGAVLPDAVQDELARIAERHDLLVYSDEIYDRLAYGTYRHRAFSALPGMKERTILMGGFSKAYAMTGWRIGWLAAPPEIVEGILKIHQYTIMTAPTIAQDAALVAIVEGEPDVARMVAEYDRRRRLVVDGFNAMGLETFEPRGAFYAFPRITSTGLDSETFARRLLEEERVAVIPGSAFGPSGEGHVRACYATSYEQPRGGDRPNRTLRRTGHAGLREEKHSGERPRIALRAREAGDHHRRRHGRPRRGLRAGTRRTRPADPRGAEPRRRPPLHAPEVRAGPVRRGRWRCASPASTT